MNPLTTALACWVSVIAPEDATGGAPAAQPSTSAEPAEETEDEAAMPAEVYDDGIKWTFGKKGRNSLRLITWHQVWGRYAQTNPGTEVNHRPTGHQNDIGLRRSRVLLVAQFTDRFQLVTHFGINNLTFNNPRTPQFQMHDATAQFRIWREYLYVGAGLHYWHGVSRMTSASTLSLMSLDAPILNWPTLEKSDRVARNLGIYAKGKIGPFDYRMAVNQPFTVTDDDGLAPVGATDYTPNTRNYEYAGYFQWQFLEKESNALPFTVGTYLGTKKVFNLGFGFQVQPGGMWDQTTEGRVREHDIVLLGADTFLDLPFGDDRGALTAYAVYYAYDFGPNHLRNIGVMNTGSGGSSLNGPGNAYPVIGTGHHGYGQLGYMQPWRGMGLHRLQPYGALQLSWFQALDEPSVVPEGGINWAMLAHHTKLTLMYRNRPVFDATPNGSARVRARRSEVVVQAMMYF